MQIITICQWNGKTDFNSLMKEDIQGIYINTDPFFYYNLDAFMTNRKVREHFKLGFQYQLTARSKTEAKQEAYSFYKMICNLPYDLPPKVDVRDLRRLAKEEVNELEKAFAEMFLELSQVKVIISDGEFNQNELTVTEGRLYMNCQNRVRHPIDHVEYVIYTALEGDTISKIANLYHVTMNDLLRVNQKLNHGEITGGSQIRISIDSSRSQYNKFILHTVEEDDTMSKISKQYNTSIHELEELNLMEKPYFLCPGQVMKIPSAR